MPQKKLTNRKSNFSINVLYEDKNILAIDKPAGISVHGDGRSREKTIADWFAKKYPKSKKVGEFTRIATRSVAGGPLLVDEKEIPRPGIVHRLDKDTSGVMIIVKNKKAFEYFKKQFMEREIKKVYNTLVYGHVKDDRGIINASIGRSPNDHRKRIASRGKKGKLKEAVTEYRVLKRLTLPLTPSLVRAGEASPDKGRLEGLKYTWLEARPKTGRTHQIRVHMKFLNHPVVCDKLYAGDMPCPKNLKRMALHARSIEFKNLAGKIIKIESPLPKELKIFAE